MALKFVFLDSQMAYCGRDWTTSPVSGTESCTVLLGQALARRGHEVFLCNQLATPLDHDGIRYRPLTEVGGLGSHAIAVSNNNISILGRVPARARVVWAHLDLRLRRIQRRGDLLSVVRLRPHVVVPSRYSAGRTPGIVPFRSRSIIEHGIDASFAREAPAAGPPPPVAVFASQPGRNLALVLKAWREQVHPALPNARLHIYLPRAEMHPGEIPDQAALGIEIKGSVGKGNLADAFRTARVMICPGHKEETFCNAAAEAIATGLPVVTLGIGALAERVRHDVDGFVVPTVPEMGEHALKVLADDALWHRMHCAGIAVSGSRSWDLRALEWERAAERWI